MNWLVIVLLALAYGPYHSPMLGNNRTATVDVSSSAANGELGFDDITMQTTPSPNPTETSPFMVLSHFICFFCVSYLWLFTSNYDVVTIVVVITLSAISNIVERCYHPFTTLMLLVCWQACPNFTNFSCSYLYLGLSRSVACLILCTSHFVDSITISHGHIQIQPMAIAMTISTVMFGPGGLGHIMDIFV